MRKTTKTTNRLYEERYTQADMLAALLAARTAREEEAAKAPKAEPAPATEERVPAPEWMLWR